jgi:hypothetical protein
LGILPIDHVFHGWGVVSKDVLPTTGATAGFSAVLGVLLVMAAWWSMIGPNAFDIDQRWREDRGTRPRQHLVLAAA